MYARHVLSAAAVFVLVSSGADSASAEPRTYSLSGRFAVHRPQMPDLPLIGSASCDSLTVMFGPGPTATVIGNPTTPPTRGTRPAHLYWCIAGAGMIATSGKGAGGELVLPEDAFVRPLPDSVIWRDPPNVPGPFQVQTSFAFAGPDADAAFRASAWSNQAGRAGANITWCPGDPACTKVTPARHAIVKYTAGPNRFGGTVRMLASAGPNPSKVVASVPGFVSFFPIASTGARATGAGYAVVKTDPAVSGSGFANYMASSMGRVTMGTTYLGPRPGMTFMHYGFPFTTGRVLVRRTGTRFGAPATSTLSAVGGDTVTAMGARNISLVAGSVAASALATESLGIAHLALPEPGALAQRLAAVIALLAVAVWRARSSHPR